MSRALVELLEDLKRRGVEVSVDGDRIAVRPAALVEPHERALLALCRDELLEQFDGRDGRNLEGAKRDGTVPFKPTRAEVAELGPEPEVYAYGRRVERSHVAEQLELAGEVELLERFEAGKLSPAELDEVLEATKLWLKQRIQLRSPPSPPWRSPPPRPEPPKPKRQRHYHHGATPSKLRQT